MLRIEAFRLDFQQEQTYDTQSQAHQSVTPTHDRRYDDAQTLNPDPDRLPPRSQKLRRLSRRVPGCGKRRRPETVPYTTIVIRDYGKGVEKNEIPPEKWYPRGHKPDLVREWPFTEDMEVPNPFASP